MTGQSRIIRPDPKEEESNDSGNSGHENRRLDKMSSYKK